jgi:oligopeptide transport system substrate-binding protein
MKISRSINMAALFGVAALAVSSCTSQCSKKPETSSSTTAGQEKSAEQVPDTSGLKGVDVARKAVALNFLDEPKNMDAQKASDQVAIMILSHTNEGLTRLDQSSNPIPAVAESWEMKGETKYIFKIRPTAKWDDGKAVTAGDFEFAWKRGLDPKLASEYAFFLYPLKNAKAANKGEKPIDEVGVKAIDDSTLEVTLEQPTGYFIRTLNFPTFFPARKDFVEKQGEKYAAEAETLISNGPFKVTEWKHNSSIKLTKSETYWNKDQIALNEVNMPYLIRDENSEYNMFKDGKYALMQTIAKERLQDAQENKLQIRKYNVGTVWYFQINTTRALFANQNFRRALKVGIDRNEYVNQVNGIPGARPAYGLIPDYMPGVAATFGEEFDRSFKDADIAKAKEYLAAAMKEMNLKEIPEFSILGSDSTTSKRDLEYYQRYLKEKLGLNVKLDFQTFKVRLERTDRKDYDIVLSGWGPDYLDPMTFADLFTSWNGNNNTGWKSAEYDALIKKAQGTADNKVRMESMAKADKILIEQAPIINLFQAGRVYVQDPRLVGVIRSPVGADPDFYFARINETVANK